MEMQLESMERWGIVGIFKEAAKLLRKHFRLFMPFVLAFHLPASFLTVFQNVFLAPPNPLTKALLNSAHTAIHGEGLKDADNQPFIILTYAFLSLIFIFSTLAVAAFTYTVDNIYTTNTSDDVTRKVFKLLPGAFLRVFVTQVWASLALLLVVFACLLIAFLLNALFTGGDPYAFIVLYWLLLAVGTVPMMVGFALAQFVAVLEKGSYGRAALKQSWGYARGRPGTIFGVIFFSELVGGLVYFSAHAVATAAGLPLGVEVAAACVISVVFSLFSAYVALVGVVTYFVCRSGSGAAALPVFTVSAAENPYVPVVSGTAQVGEP